MDSDPYLTDICQGEEGKYTFYIYIYSANVPYFLITFLKAHKIKVFKAPGSGDRKYEDTYLEGRAGFLPQWTGHILKMPIKYK